MFKQTKKIYYILFSGHYEFKANEVFKDYKLIRHLSDGTFGRVFEVEKNGRTYALKMIRAVPRYVDSAKTEVAIIEDI